MPEVSQFKKDIVSAREDVYETEDYWCIVSINPYFSKHIIMKNKKTGAIRINTIGDQYLGEKFSNFSLGIHWGFGSSVNQDSLSKISAIKTKST